MHTGNKEVPGVRNSNCHSVGHHYSGCRWVTDLTATPSLCHKIYSFTWHLIVTVNPPCRFWGFLKNGYIHAFRLRVHNCRLWAFFKGNPIISGSRYVSVQHQLFKWITKLDKKAYLGCQLLSYFGWQCLQEFSLFLFARIPRSFDPVSVILVSLSLSDVCLSRKLHLLASLPVCRYGWRNAL